jgi:hypothetical protein
MWQLNATGQTHHRDNTLEQLFERAEVVLDH